MSTIKKRKSRSNKNKDDIRNNENVKNREERSLDVTTININYNFNDLVKEQQQEQQQQQQQQQQQKKQRQCKQCRQHSRKSTVELQECVRHKQIKLNKDDVLFEVNFLRKSAYEKYGAELNKIIKKKLYKMIKGEAECWMQEMPEHSSGVRIKLIYKKAENYKSKRSKSRKYKSKKRKSRKREVHNPENIWHIESKFNDNDEDTKKKLAVLPQYKRMRERSLNECNKNNIFLLDTEPTETINISSVPSYEKFCTAILGDDNYEINTIQQSICDKRYYSERFACFNCGDFYHRIRDCTLPRDHKRIKNAVQLFKRKDRYHTNVKNEFASIEPGTLSDDVREALGLRKNELPLFYYRMRLYGYPPGWLEDAKLYRSNMVIYGADGKVCLASDEEEGEIHKLPYRYNTGKIIDFPGYNQYPGDNFYDKYKSYNVPRFSKHQSKENFIKSLGSAVFHGYKRRKLTHTTTTSSKTVSSKANTTINITKHTNFRNDNTDLAESKNCTIVKSLPREKSLKKSKPLKSVKFELPILGKDKENEAERASINLPDFDLKLNSKSNSGAFDLVGLKFEQGKRIKTENVQSISNDNKRKRLEASISDDDSLIDEILELEEMDEKRQQQQIQLANDIVPQADIEMKDNGNNLRQRNVIAHASSSMKQPFDSDQPATSKSSAMINTPNGMSEKPSPSSLSISSSSLSSLSLSSASASASVSTFTDSNLSNTKLKDDDDANVYLGTPILKFSKYDRLPKLENFRKDISDITNLQNETTKTGNYENMLKVLKKVRNVMTKLNE